MAGLTAIDGENSLQVSAYSSIHDASVGMVALDHPFTPHNQRADDRGGRPYARTGLQLFHVSGYPLNSNENTFLYLSRVYSRTK